MKIKSEHDNVILPCKSCKKELNIKIKNCFNCGDEDPFIFKWVEKLSEQFDIIFGGASIIVMIFFIWICFKYSWWWLVLLFPIFMALNLLSVFFISRRMKKIDNYYEFLLENDYDIQEDVWSYYIGKTINI